VAGIRVGIGTLVAAALCSAAGCGGSGTLGAKGLAKQAEAVQSLAAEGALLAEDSALGRATRIYRREHSSELAKAASTVAGSLRKGRAEPPLEPRLRRLSALAVRVRTALAELGSASTDEQRAIARRLAAAAKASEKIAEELG
jgi:hypothetical protein